MRRKKILKDFEIQTDHLILARTPDLMLSNKKKRTCRLIDFAVQENHKLWIKEKDNINKYLDLAREPKQIWNMQVTEIPIVIDALETVPKGLEEILK